MAEAINLTEVSPISSNFDHPATIDNSVLRFGSNVSISKWIRSLLGYIFHRRDFHSRELSITCEQRKQG